MLSTSFVECELAMTADRCYWGPRRCQTHRRHIR